MLKTKNNTKSVFTNDVIVTLTVSYWVILKDNIWFCAVFVMLLREPNRSPDSRILAEV